MIISNPDFRVVRCGHLGYRNGLFELRTPMQYLWAAKRCVVEVPAGTLTDFASIPRGFRNVVSVNGAHRLPAVLHDYLYGQAGSVPVVALVNVDGSVAKLANVQTIHYTRKEADEEFRVAMRLEGVSRFTASVMYRAVRIFGGVHLKLTGGKEWKK